MFTMWPLNSIGASEAMMEFSGHRLDRAHVDLRFLG